MTGEEWLAVSVAVGAVVVSAVLAWPRSAPVGPGLTCVGPDAAVACAIADADADVRP